MQDKKSGLDHSITIYVSFANRVTNIATMVLRLFPELMLTAHSMALFGAADRAEVSERSAGHAGSLDHG